MQCFLSISFIKGGTSSTALLFVLFTTTSDLSMIDIKFNHLIGCNKIKHKDNFVWGTVWPNEHWGMPELVCATGSFLLSGEKKRKRQWFQCARGPCPLCCDGDWSFLSVWLYVLSLCVWLRSLVIKCKRVWSWVYDRVWTELFCQQPCSQGIVWSCGSLLEYRSGFLPQAALKACCQISLATSTTALQGPGQPSCSSHKPFHVLQPQAKSGASLLQQHQRMCLPNSWDMMTVVSQPRMKKNLSLVSFTHLCYVFSLFPSKTLHIALYHFFCLLSFTLVLSLFWFVCLKLLLSHTDVFQA